MRERYRDLLAIPGFRALLAVSILARIPLGMCSLAVLLLVREHSGSFAVAGIASGAFALGSAAAAPVQGAVVDRFAPRRVLPVLAIAQGVLLATLAGAAATGVPDAPLVVLAAATGTLTPPVSAVVRVLWPVLARNPDELDAAYALDAVTQEIIFVSGPLLVGLLTAVAGPTAAVLAAATVTSGGTLAFVRLEVVAGRGPRTTPRPPSGALAARGIRVLLPVVVLTGVMVGAVEVALPALAEDVGHDWASGVLLAVWALGSAAGGIAYGARSWRVAAHGRLAGLLLASAVVVVPLAAAGALGTGLLLATIAGAGIAPVLACQNALCGELAPVGATTEAFTWLVAALVSGIAAGSALAGVLAGDDRLAAAFLLGSAAAGAASLATVAGRGALRPAG